MTVGPTDLVPPEATESLSPELPAAEPLSEVEELRLQLLATQIEVQQERDLRMRAAAELDNVRKRAQRDVENAHRFGLEKFAQELIPVKDSLDLAVENAARSDAAALAEGQAATLRLLSKALERVGIVELVPEGQPFDANLHEAIATQPSDVAEPNSVLTVVQRGYSLNGRLLRPARVVVSAQSQA